MDAEKIHEMQKEAIQCANNLKKLEGLVPNDVIILDADGETVELNGEAISSIIAAKAKSVLKSRRDSLAREVRKANQALMSGDDAPKAAKAEDEHAQGGDPEELDGGFD